MKTRVNKKKKNSPNIKTNLDHIKCETQCCNCLTPQYEDETDAKDFQCNEALNKI